jgi:pilus assembly protein Flp/PilA
MLKLYVATQEKLLALKEDISGATAIEYGLIAAGISIAILVAVQLLGGQLTNLFGALTTAVTPATP